jgi:hypothetical protein
MCTDIVSDRLSQSLWLRISPNGETSIPGLNDFINIVHIVLAEPFSPDFISHGIGTYNEDFEIKKGISAWGNVSTESETFV